MTIKTQSKFGYEYFTIYEVRAVKSDDDDKRIVLDRYSTREAAENYKEFCYEAYNNLYSCVYVYEVTVWVK